MSKFIRLYGLQEMVNTSFIRKIYVECNSDECWIQAEMDNSTIIRIISFRDEGYKNHCEQYFDELVKFQND